MSLQKFIGKFKSFVRKNLNRKVIRLSEEVYAETVNEIERDILAHPLSKELISNSNTSVFFDRPKGSLFGFMGFNTGRSPIKELLNFLRSEDGFKLDYDKFGQASLRKNLQVSFLSPSEKNFIKAGIVLDKWNDGRSWPDVVETGITGLSHYFVKEGRGRSLKGFQIERTLRAGDTLEPIPYLSPIFQKAVNRFKNKIAKKLAR